MSLCLVTGGAGFIGSHLCEALLQMGHSVRVLDDLSTGRLENVAAFGHRLEFIQGSIIDGGVVEQAVAGCDVVFHLAALPSVTQSVERPLVSHGICATGTMIVLDAARRAKVRRVVYAASSSAYGDQPGELRRENDPLVPLSPYAAAKLAGEHYCQAFTTSYGLETVRLRFFNVFGPRQDAKSPYSGVISIFCAALVERREPTIYGDGLQTRDFVYVADVVQALCKAAQAPTASGKVYNIGNGRSVTILELLQQLQRIAGFVVRPRFAPPRAGDVRHSRADISMAQRDLDYQPTFPLAEGLERTFKSLLG
ncbi:MAG: SDR family oxidoreductase [Gemmataceae bacterium]|nr:SDR family oxidoreductase [Gemmataceae bacterium]